MIIILFLATVSLTTLILLEILSPKARPLEALALGYMIGMGLFTYLIFFINILGFPINFLNIILILALYLALSLTAFFLIKPEINLKKYFSVSKLEIFLNLILISYLIWVIAFSWYWPVKDWDAIVLYDFRAKVIAQSGQLGTAINQGYFWGYPLFISLAHTIIYSLGGLYPGVIHSLFFASLILIIYSFIAKNTNKYWAFFWIFIIIFNTDLYQHALLKYSNLAYSAYLISGCLYFVEWLKIKNIKNLIISAILIAFSTWARSTEPFWLIPIIFIFIISVKQRKILNFIYYSSIIFSIKSIWNWYRIAHNKETEALISTTPRYANSLLNSLDINKIIEVSWYFFETIIKPRNFFISLSVVILSLFYLRFKNKYQTALVLLLLILCYLVMIWFGIFYYSLFFDTWKEIPGSITRMALFIQPLGFIFAAITLWPKIRKK